MTILNIFNPIRKRVRRYIRKRMMPMSVDEAMEKREFFAKFYALSMFSVFTYLLCKVYRNKVQSFDETVPLAEATIEKLKVTGEIRILKFEGFKKVDDYFYEKKENEVKKAVNPDVELLVETSPEGNS